MRLCRICITLRNAVNSTLPPLTCVYTDFLARKIQALGPDWEEGRVFPNTYSIFLNDNSCPLLNCVSISAKWTAKQGEQLDCYHEGSNPGSAMGSPSFPSCRTFLICNMGLKQCLLCGFSQEQSEE